MGKYLLVFLSLLLVGTYVYREKNKETSTPRESMEKALIEARKTAAKELTRDEEQVLLLQIALLNFRAQKGNPPNALADLVPEYFDSIPKNPATNKPFEYERKGSAWVIGDIRQVGTSDKALAKGGPGTGGKGTGLSGDADFVNPNLMPAETFIYDAAGKRDPFRSFDFSARPKNGGAATPLERYSLGQLRLTAVISDTKGGSTALIEDSAGKGFSIKMGAKIGDRGGVVIGITPDRLKILESSSDFTGKEEQRVVEMKIQTQADQPATKKR